MCNDLINDYSKRPYIWFHSKPAEKSCFWRCPLDGELSTLKNIGYNEARYELFDSKSGNSYALNTETCKDSVYNADDWMALF